MLDVAGEDNWRSVAGLVAVGPGWRWPLVLFFDDVQAFGGSA
jgi:hypothetical protein